MPQLTGESKSARALFFEHEGNRSVHEGPWKLVCEKSSRWELYDIIADRTELNDLAAEHPDIVHRLSNKWHEWAKEQYVFPLPGDYGVGYLKPATK